MRSEHTIAPAVTRLSRVRDAGARLLLVLTPWPAADHDGNPTDSSGEGARPADLFEPAAGAEVADAARQAIRQDVAEHPGS